MLPFCSPHPLRIQMLSTVLTLHPQDPPGGESPLFVKRGNPRHEPGHTLPTKC